MQGVLSELRVSLLANQKNADVETRHCRVSRPTTTRCNGRRNV